MNIAIIPARGGSKRIPRKNIKPFYGKPMLAYPILAALESGLFDQVVVSTDDDEIAEVAQAFGASVPFKRPAALAQDDTATAPVIIHAIEWFEAQGHAVKEAACFYPCTPFVDAHLLNQAYAHWQATDAAYCFAVCEYPSAPQRALKQLANGRLESMYPQYRLTRTQDLEKTFFDAGQFYFTDAQTYKTGVSMHSDAATPFILPRHLAHDIDTLEDWHLAELMYGVLNPSAQLQTEHLNPDLAG
jgi:N-acylneuraminate cytidylyltransferase